MDAFTKSSKAFPVSDFRADDDDDGVAVAMGDSITNRSFRWNKNYNNYMAKEFQWAEKKAQSQ